MGVLTKPDLLAPPRYPYTERMLKGEKFKLRKGWFVAKSSSQAELDEGVTHAEARERERTFFAINEPWCSSLASLANRFGVLSLQDAISQELTQHILDEYVPCLAQMLLANLLAAFPRSYPVLKPEWSKYLTNSKGSPNK